jgi:hypothetical protein
MFAVPPEQAEHFLFQQGSVSTIRQLWPLGHTVPSTQSAASKQPAGNTEGIPHAGTSQRQLGAMVHTFGSVIAEHGCAGQFG